MPKHTHNGKTYYLTKQRIKAGILATLYGAGQTEPITSFVFREGTSEHDMFNKLIKIQAL